MLFVKCFDDDSKNFRKNLKQTFKLQNQKINFIKSVKKVIANLMSNDVKQIEKILIKIIEMFKIDLKKNRKFIEIKSNIEQNRKQVFHYKKAKY